MRRVPYMVIQAGGYLVLLYCFWQVVKLMANIYGDQRLVQDRRKSDTDLTCIKVALARIEEHIEQYAKTQINCEKARDALFSKTNKLNERVSSLETKQRLVSWIGGTVALTWFGAISKWVAQHFK